VNPPTPSALQTQYRAAEQAVFAAANPQIKTLAWTGRTRPVETLIEEAARLLYRIAEQVSLDSTGDLQPLPLLPWAWMKAKARRWITYWLSVTDRWGDEKRARSLRTRQRRAQKMRQRAARLARIGWSVRDIARLLGRTVQSIYRYQRQDRADAQAQVQETLLAINTVWKAVTFVSDPSSTSKVDKKESDTDVTRQPPSETLPEHVARLQPRFSPKAWTEWAHDQAVDLWLKKQGWQKQAGK